ncbi:o-succinylbenzoate synthase [Rhodocaloribacter sp.]
MRLAAYHSYRFRLPLAPPLRLKGRDVSFREGCLVRLRAADGREGWGEVSPLPGFSAETLAGAEADLARVVAAMAREGWSDDPPEILHALGARMDALDPLPSVRFGVELAMMNLTAAVRGEALPFVLTPHARNAIPVNALLTEEADLATGIERVRAGGYRVVKLKVGRRAVARDVERVRRVRALLGPDVVLRLDANRAWDLPTATVFADGVRGAGIAYVEEPLADPSGLRAFVANTGLPVALDETMPGLDPEALVDHRYARAVVLKPTLCGGLTKTLRLASSASALGMTPVLSSAFESGVGTLGVAALAACAGPEETAAGLDPYRRLRADVLAPPLDVTSRIAVPELWGARRAVRLEALEEIAGGRL